MCECERHCDTVTRFGWEQNGWCGVAGMLTRCALAQIQACWLALKSTPVFTKLLREQRRVLLEIRQILNDCRRLSDLRETLTASRTGLCLSLRVDDDVYKQHVERDMRQYLLQFKTDSLSAEFASMNRVRGWILQQALRTKDKWTYSWAEVKRCCEDFSSGSGARVHLRDVWNCFNRLGYIDAVTAEQIEEMLSDDKMDV